MEDLSTSTTLTQPLPSNNYSNPTPTPNKGTLSSPHPPPPTNTLHQYQTHMHQCRNHLTPSNFVRHGMEIVNIEAICFGRKSLPWRIRYRNRDGLMISFIYWCWYRSMTNAYTIYIVTHGIHEMLLWYKIGKRYAYTMGSNKVHPNLSPDRNNSLINNVGERLTAQTPANYATQCKAVNCVKWHRLLASQILSANKGKRKTHDRPKRHQQWIAARHNNNAKHSNKLATNSTGRKKIQLCHQSPLRKKETSTTSLPHTHNNQRQRNRLIPFASKKGRPPIRLWPKQNCKNSIAMPSSRPAMTNKTHTEPSNLLRCIANCLGGEVFWGNVFPHLIEGSGLVKPRRDVIKWIFHCT